MTTTTEWKPPTYEVKPGRATVWLTSYRFNIPTEEEAIRLAIFRAEQDVPEATTKVMSTRRTPKGTWVVTVKRDRSAALVSIEAECQRCGDWVYVPGDEDPEDTLCVACAEDEFDGEDE